MTKKENKLDNFKKAVKRLNDANTHYKTCGDEFARDALIQRFEFTFELAWKTLYETLAEQGLGAIIQSPRSVFQTAFQAGILDQGELWLDMLTARNSTAHQYNEEDAKQIADDISMRFCPALRNLQKKLN